MGPSCLPGYPVPQPGWSAYCWNPLPTWRKVQSWERNGESQKRICRGLEGGSGNEDEERYRRKKRGTESISTYLLGCPRSCCIISYCPDGKKIQDSEAFSPRHRKSKVKGLESQKKKAHIDDSLTPVGKKKSQSAHRASEALPSTPTAPPSAMKRKEGELKARSLTEPRAEFKKAVGREGLIQGGTPLGASDAGKVKKAKMQPASERKAKAGEGRKDKK